MVPDVAIAAPPEKNMNKPALRLLRAALSIVLVALAAACGGGSGSSAARTDVGPEGGTVVGPDGVQVVVPAGALSEAVTIGIARRSEGAPATLPADNRLAGAIYEFTPHGLVFQKPVTIRMPVGAEIHQHALGDLLVVRIVTQFRRREGDALHQRPAVAHIVEIGLRPVQALLPVQGAHRRVHPVQ